MRDILLKRNDLRKRSSCLRIIKFDPDLNDRGTDKISEEQNRIYNHWKFYDKFIKAREEVKNENKSCNLGETK